MECGMECEMEVSWVLIGARVLIDFWEGSFKFQPCTAKLSYNFVTRIIREGTVRYSCKCISV